MLTAQNLTVEKAGAALVQEAGLEVRAGEMTVIIGPNGAGKTTLVRALTGDEPHYRGEVRLDDRPLRQYSPGDLSRRIAYLPQQVDLNFPFRVIEVVLLGRSPHYGFLETKTDGHIAFAALDRVGMAAFAQRDYTTLSGGEKQRVGLARTLAQIWDRNCDHENENNNGPDGEAPRKHKLLVLDEPTNNLDLKHQLQTLAIARDECRRGNAVLAILHDLNQAAHVADHLVVMKEGGIVTKGPPAKILTADLIQRVFEVPVSLRPGSDGPPLIEPRLWE